MSNAMALLYPHLEDTDKNKTSSPKKKERPWVTEKESALEKPLCDEIGKYDKKINTLVKENGNNVRKVTMLRFFHKWEKWQNF